MFPASPVVARWSLAALLALAACSSSHRGKVANVGQLHQATAAAESNVDLHLLDAGQAPRAPLRYRLTAGQHDTLLIELITELKLAVGDLSPPAVRSPTIYAVLDVAVATAGPRIELTGKVVKLDVPDDPTLDPKMIAALRSDLDRLAGTPWSAVFTDRGQLETLRLPDPADANTQALTNLHHLREALHLLLPPLPDAPVGQGARWLVRRRTVIASAHVEERIIYKLESTDGHPKVSLTVGMDARPQQLALPYTPTGTTTALTSFEAGGKGQVELALTDLVQPTTLRWSALGRGTASPAGEPPAPMTMNIDASISVRRR